MQLKSTIIIIFLNAIACYSWSQQLTTGGRHSLVICSDSTVQAWGYNGYGQLGENSTDPHFSGVQVRNISKASFVAAGLFHSIFITSDGSAWTCGRNAVGQLGDGSNINQLEPVKINSLNNVRSASGGGEHTLFLLNDGTVYSAGLNTSGQLGIDNRLNINNPQPVKGITDIVQVAAGAEFSLFLKSDGSVWACGHNGFGQFGNGTNISSNKAVQIPDLQNVIYISAGEWHSLFVKSDGTVWSSGRNQYGQLGLGHKSDINKITQIPSLTDIVKAEAGGIHSVFVKNDGTVWACGLNSGGNNDGQLGDGTAVDRLSPVQVLPNWSNEAVIHAEAAREHSLFLLQSGEVWGAGRNNYGQLGYGISTTNNSSTAVLASKLCEISTTSGSDLFSLAEEVFIYPNPASGFITLNFKNDTRIHNIKAFSLIGVVSLEHHNSGSGFKIELAGLNEGIYILKVVTDKGIISSKFSVIKAF